MTFLKACLFIIISLHLSSSMLTDEEITPQPCTPQMRASFKNFYEKNKIEHDFVIPTDQFTQLNCFFKYIELKRTKRVIMYTEVGLGEKGALCSLVLSRTDPSSPFFMEDDSNLPDYDITCNKLILEDQNDEDARADRVLSILNIVLLDQLRNLHVKEYKNKLPFYYIMKIVGVEAMTQALKFELWGEDFKAKNPYLSTNFDKWLVELAETQADNIKNYVNLKIANYLNEDLKESTFAALTSNSELVHSSLTYLQSQVHALVLESQVEGRVGGTSMVKELNHMLSRVSGQNLRDFLNSFHKKIDKKKGRKWKFELANEDVNSQENIGLMISEIDRISPEVFYFFLLEEFLLFGNKYETSVNHFINMVIYPISSWTYIEMTDREKTYLTKFAMENRWLQEQTFKGVTSQSVMKSCKAKIDSQSGNVIYYSVFFGPDLRKDECVVVVKRTYSTSRDFSQELVLDTNGMYWNQKSCLKLTRNLASHVIRVLV